MEKSFDKPRIGEILVEQGHLSRESLKEALEIQKREGGLLGEILIRTGVLTEENLVTALAKQYEFPFLRISRYQVNREAVSLVPRQIAERYKALAFDSAEGLVSLAVVEPLEDQAMAELKKRVGGTVQVFISTVSEIKNGIDQYYPSAEKEGRKEKNR